MIAQAIGAMKSTATGQVRHWLLHLGGVGLIPLGLLDNSMVPVPGSMDVATALLASRERDWWPYYALMATMGSVLGALLTYRLAQKGGKATLERRVSKRRASQIYGFFERWGFSTLFVASLLPPPAPMVPFLVAAGALQYPAKKFVAALVLGRGIRYTAVAYFGSVYGTAIIHFIGRHERPAIWAVGALAAVGIGAAVLSSLLRKRRRRAA